MVNGLQFCEPNLLDFCKAHGLSGILKKNKFWQLLSRYYRNFFLTTNQNWPFFKLSNDVKLHLLKKKLSVKTMFCFIRILIYLAMEKQNDI